MNQNCSKKNEFLLIIQRKKDIYTCISQALYLLNQGNHHPNPMGLITS